MTRLPRQCACCPRGFAGTAYFRLLALDALLALRQRTGERTTQNAPACSLSHTCGIGSGSGQWPSSPWRRHRHHHHGLILICASQQPPAVLVSAPHYLVASSSGAMAQRVDESPRIRSHVARTCSPFVQLAAPSAPSARLPLPWMPLPWTQEKEMA